VGDVDAGDIRPGQKRVTRELAAFPADHDVEHGVGARVGRD
jgi:hypothetical protein